MDLKTIEIRERIAEIENAFKELQALKAAPAASRWESLLKMLSVRGGYAKGAVQIAAKSLGYGLLIGGAIFVIRDIPARGGEIGAGLAVVEGGIKMAALENPPLLAVVVVSEYVRNEFDETVERATKDLKNLEAQGDFQGIRLQMQIALINGIVDADAKAIALAKYNELAAKIKVKEVYSVQEAAVGKAIDDFYNAVKSLENLKAWKQIDDAEFTKRFRKAEERFKDELERAANPNGSPWEPGEGPET